MITKLKKYYNKENFDYSKGHIEPHKFHPTFYFMLKAFQVIDLEAIPRWTYFALSILAATATIAITLTLIATGYGVYISDLSTMTEAVVYSIFLAHEFLILMCTQLNKPQYHCFLRVMREDFLYVCGEGNKYRDRFFANQLVTWQISLLSIVFSCVIGVGMVAYPTMALLYYTATHAPDDRNERPPLFPFWLGDDVNFGKTPLFEVAFMFSVFCVLAYAYNYVFMLQTQIVWVRQITTKADLVIWAIQDIFQDIHPATNSKEKAQYADLIKYRMGEIISQHHSMYTLMEAYAGVYKKILLYEQKLCGPVVCLTAFCTAEKLDDGEFHALFLLCIATFIVVLLTSYLCTYLSIKVKSVGDACWNTPFWNAGPEIRPYFVLIMQRSLRPLPLQAPGFEEVSLKTFSSKMTSAYSLFNMLRQTNI